MTEPPAAAGAPETTGAAHAPHTSGPPLSPSTAARWSRRAAALLLGGLLAALLAEAGLRLHAALVLDGAADRGGMDGQLTEHHPVLGWLGLPGAQVRHRTTEFDVTYRISADGFRALPDDVTAPREGRPRVTLLGDSFLFGQGVDEQLRLSVWLSRALDIEVTERALPATGSGQHVLFYEQPGRHHGADVVVLGFLPEHIERLAAERWAGRAKPRFRAEDLVRGGDGSWRSVPDSRLVLDNLPVPDDVLPLDARAAPTDAGFALPGKRFLQRHSRLYGLLRRHLRQPLRDVLGRAPDDPHPTLAEGTVATETLRLLLARLAQAVRADSGRLMVTFLPEPWHIAHPEDRRHQETLARLCASLGVAFVDLGLLVWPDDHGPDRLPTLGEGPVFFPVDGHWTPADHDWMARQLGLALIREGLDVGER